LNDEAHHCYREKPAAEAEEGQLKGDDRKEAERNSEAARVWISGLEAVQRKLGLQRVIDLSATPFFLRGSGCREGTLVPWTASDFSLMDAIECGIVKLPRVPVADNIPGRECRPSGTCGSISVPRCRSGAAARRAGSIRSARPVELQTKTTSIVAAGRSTGAPGLPQGNDWTAWNAGEMRAAVEHLQHKLGAVTPEAQHPAPALLR